MIGPVVVFREAAAERRSDAHHLEVIPAHADRRHALRLAIGHERRYPRAHHRELFEAAAPLAPVEDRREPDVRREPREVAIAERDEALRLRVRQRPQQHGVDDGEDGGVGADAERQRDKRGGREPRGPPQHPEAVPDILRQRLEHREAALIAPRVGDLRLAAEIQSGGAARRRRVEAAGAVALFQHGEMEPQLLTELPLAPPKTERASGAREQLTQAHGMSSRGGAPPSRRAMIAAIRCQSSASRRSCFLPARVRV